MARCCGAILDRFLSRVEKTESCWLWKGFIDRNGYGKFGSTSAMSWAHRASYMLLVGPIPKGLTIDHLCKVKNCVNPLHLRVVTIKENILCSDGVTAKNSVKTHCVNGHELTEENTYIRKEGWRHCRKCNAERQAKYRQ